MALDINSTTKYRFRAVGFGFLGLLLLIAAGVLLYDALLQRGSLVPSSTYKYTINQSVNNSVEYVNNSYYPDGPAPDNTAYVTELTKSFSTDFHYSYEASEAQQLQYTYDIVAVVRGMYGVPGSEEDSSNVWSKHFQLVKPTTKSINTKSFKIDETATVPFDEYKKIIEDFRLGLTLPVTSQIELKFTIKVQGNVAGEAFSDTRTSTVSTPLNVQIYQLATKYDKTDTKEVAKPALPTGKEWRTQAEIIGAAILGVGAAICLFKVFRRSTYKSAYQRELEKIYRYHDGIIIRTRQPVKVSANKSVVPVNGFDDILNLEEETKSPIIASPAGETATRFMIAEGDIVYVYVLGKEPSELAVGEDMRSIEESLARHKKPALKKRPLGAHAVKKQTKK